MQVRAKLLGTLRRFATDSSGNHWTGEVAEGTRISEILTEIGISPNEVTLVYVEGVPMHADAVLPPEPRREMGPVNILILPPVGGG